jgi:hypothetical protein
LCCRELYKEIIDVSVSLAAVLTRIHDCLFLFLYPGSGFVYTSFGPSHGYRWSGQIHLVPKVNPPRVRPPDFWLK